MQTKPSAACSLDFKHQFSFSAHHEFDPFLAYRNLHACTVFVQMLQSVLRPGHHYIETGFIELIEDR